jgi:serine protease AprX
MPQVSVLLEFVAPQQEAFGAFSDAAESESEAVAQAESLLAPLANFGLELEGELTPVPMFSEPEAGVPMEALEAFATPETNPDVPAPTSVVAARVDEQRLAELRERSGVIVWANSDLTLYTSSDVGVEVAPAAVDCRPFKAAVTIDEIRDLLDVESVWSAGSDGKDVVVGIIDEGVNGTEYPVAGGFRRPGSLQPGDAPVTSHGSMCAADVLIGAPDARLYDYPFLGQPQSGGALAMFQAVLEQRRLDGTPHLTSNSYGFVAVPPRASAPGHEIWDLNHPVHRKVREVIASGAPAFFAAGNCGENCPSGACHVTGIGPGKSISASNSLVEVITVAAVNSRRERIGYSSQGPGMFEQAKPDLAAFSHIFGNFGPGRPGGEDHQPFDNGTSAATPVAAGVGALLLSAFPTATPADLRGALVDAATPAGAPGWDPEFGHGVVHAGASFLQLREAMAQ